MRRRTLDALLAAGGLVVAVVLLVAGGLLVWAHQFTSDQVRTQLTAQKIFVPPAGSDALANPEIGPYLNQYAGEQVTNGYQAKAYADHFIAVHIKEMTGGQTYSELSAKAQANPTDQKLAGLTQTVFRGETLRGLLLNAYAFWQMGVLALWASIISFVAAGVMFVLSALGFRHLRHTAPDAEVLLGAVTPATVER